jgi:uncharacterized protein HemY
VPAALGARFVSAKNYADAQRVLSRAIELSPDAWAFQTLAATYKDQGQVDRWKETLDEFLKKVQDPGLDHAKVRVQIANYYMGLRQWDKARPYAEDAAETWAQWAMDCAARCAEGEQDWERAETWYSRETERYPDHSWAVWYFFCKRTGQGNLEAARAFVEQYLTARAERPDLLNEEYAGCYYWLDGQTDKAKEAFRKAYEQRMSVSAALCLAMIDDDAKDTAKRDEILKELTTKRKDKSPQSLAVCQLLIDTVLNPGGSKPLDVAAVDGANEAMPEAGRGNVDFFVGWFLKNHGDPQNAKKYLARCSGSQHALSWYRYLAHAALKRMAGN